MNLRRIVLLACLGLTPIVLAIALAAADVIGGESDTVLSSTAVYVGEDAGRHYVLAVVSADSVSRLRPDQPATVFVPSLDTRIPGRVVAAVPIGQPAPGGLDQRAPEGLAMADASRSARMVVALDGADPRLTVGTAVGVRVSAPAP